MYIGLRDEVLKFLENIVLAARSYTSHPAMVEYQEWPSTPELNETVEASSGKKDSQQTHDQEYDGEVWTANSDTELITEQGSSSDGYTDTIVPPLPDPLR